ncbi:MAG: hypothetical protein KDA24_17610 [Deltaproteobacteria bacterium]|nr:hypothetical protein [Deltaproteobacteria bacterium]
MRCLLLVALSIVVSGCPSVEEFDLTFRNGTRAVAYMEAGDSAGVAVRIDALVDDQWLFVSPWLESLCVERCAAPGQVACAEGAADLPVAHVLMRTQGVTRHLEGEWWYVDPQRGCAKEAVMTWDLRATVCWDDIAVDASSGELLPEPTSSGVIGGVAGVELPDPVCIALPFDLRQARAKTLVFPADGQ